jgi:hypothetical protein
MGHYASEMDELPEEKAKRERYGKIHEKLKHIPLAAFMAADFPLLAGFLGVARFGLSEDQLKKLEAIICEWESVVADWEAFQTQISESSKRLAKV